MANTQNDVQIGVGMDATGVQRGADAIEGRVKTMASNVAKEGERAGKGVEAIGAGSDKAAKEVERSERSIIASIQRRTAAVEAAGKGERAYQEALLSNRGLDPARFKPYLDQLEAAERAQRVAANGLDKIGVSAKQTSAALRGVPAQFTDIVTALQGGQAPLTVFLQQGGQLKDMFGGAGAAAKALGGYVLGMINPLTIGAAALGAIAYGYNKGATESQAFERTLINSGNAAGTTAAQLGQMAGAIDRMGGATSGLAAEALNEMAASGKVGAANLQRFTQAAIELERSGGQAIQKTVEAFADLGRDPLKASLKLNESMNYLTRSTYEQIKSLEDQGRATEAAKLAQETYANTLAERVPLMEQQLGYVERAWRGVKDAAKSAVDALAEVGRTDGIDVKIEKLSREAARLRAVANNTTIPQPGEVVSSLVTGQSFASRAAELEQVVAKLRESAQLQGSMVTLQADQARQVKLLADYRKDEEKYLSRSEQLNRAITREIAQGVAAGEKMEVIQTRVTALRKQYADKGGSGASAAREMEAEADLLARLTGYTATYNNEVSRLVAMRNKGKISEQEYGDEIRKLVALQPAVVKETKALADAQEASAAAYKKVIGELDGVLSRQEREVQSLQDQYIAMVAGKEVMEQVRAAREGNALAIAEEALQVAYMERASAGEIERRLQIIETLKQEIALRQGLATATASKAVETANADAAKKASDEWQRASDQVGQSLADALMEGGKSASEYIRGLFRTMVLKPIIQGAVQPIAGAVSNMLTGSTATGQTASAMQSASMLNTAYGYGRDAYRWATGTGYSAGTTTMAASEAYGGAAAEIAGAEGGAAAGGASSLGAYAGYAALIYAAVKQGESDYARGHNRAQAEQGESALIGGSAGQFTPTAFTAWWMDALGMNEKWTSILSGSTMVARGMSDLGLIRTQHQGSVVGVDALGATSTLMGDSSGITEHFNSDVDQYLRLVSGTSTSIVRGLATSFGNTGDITATAKFSSDNNDASIGQFALNVGGQQVGYVGDGADFAKYDSNPQAAMEAFTGDIAKATRDALTALDLPQWAKEQIGKLADSATFADVQQAAQEVSAFQTALDNLAAGMAPIGGAFGQLAGLSSDALKSLADLSGGIDAFAQAAGGYVQNFYTAEEQTTIGMQQIGAVLSQVGIEAVPATREAFRALVDSLDLTTTAGQEQFTVLMQVQGAFAELNPILQDTADVARSAADIAKEKDSLERELLALQGDTTALRALELAELAPSNQALQQRIWALGEEAAAAEKAKAYLEGFTGVMANLGSTTFDLENQILTLTGKDAEAKARTRERELAGLTAGLTPEDAAKVSAQYDYNAGLREQIDLLQSAGTTWADTGSAASSAATDARNAWQSVWDGIADEVKRLRGGQATGSSAQEAEFATATAQARAGDKGAAGRLAGLARGLSEAGMNTTGTRAEFDTLNGKLAASLEKTLEVTGAPAELLAGLRTDMQGLRDDNNMAAVQNQLLLKRVSVILDQINTEGLGVRA